MKFQEGLCCSIELGKDLSTGFQHMDGQNNGDV
jgi:hypothetical protein